MKANRSQLARIFGVNRNTIAAWCDAGMPVASQGRQGREWQFETGEVHQWLLDRAVAEAVERAERAPIGDGGAYDAARARKMAADAEVAEIKLEEIRGRVVAVDEVTRIADSIFATIRAKLFSLPTKLAVKLAAARTREDAKKLLTDGLNDCLEELIFDARRARRATLEDEDDEQEVG